MDFKKYLTEAEWIAGQRYPTVEALWHILQPLSNSKSHLLSLGEGDSRSHPPHGGATDPNSFAVGVQTFMRNGTEAFHEDDFEEDSKVVLHVLRVNPRDVWVLNAKNERNPWLLMRTHWADLQREYERLLPSVQARDKTRRSLAINTPDIGVEWGNLKARIERTYRTGGDSDLGHLQYLFHLIYVEAPRFLKFMTSGMSFGNGWRTSVRSSSTEFRRLDPESTPKPYDMHYPTGMRFEFKVITKSLPLSETPWAVIIDPRAAVVANTIVIPMSFKGFRGTKDKKGFYTPNARAEVIQKFLDKFVEDFRDGMEDYLNIFLEEMENARWGSTKALIRSMVKIDEEVDKLEIAWKKVQAIDSSVEFPDNITTAIEDFERTVAEMLDHWEEARSYEDEPEENDSNLEEIKNIADRVLGDLNRLRHGKT